MMRNVPWLLVVSYWLVCHFGTATDEYEKNNTPNGSSSFTTTTADDDDDDCQTIRNNTHYRNPDLPDLWRFRNGTRVTTVSAWRERRPEIKALLLEYVYGTIPDEIPPLVHVHYGTSRRSRHGGISEHVNLTFQVRQQYNVSFDIEILRPTQSLPRKNKTTWPLFLTQTNHYRWALKAVARGYVALVYPGADIHDATPRFAQAYQNNTRTTPPTWGVIVQRAWLASRCLDFIFHASAHARYKNMIDSTSVSIAGHSRNGKQAMLAAALDERFTSIVASSSGSPAMCAYRSTSAAFFAEGPGDAPPQWWAPHLACFRGYEDRLPMDAHGLLALIAPRYLLSATAWTDGCEPTWAVERTYKAVQPIYKLLTGGEDSSQALRIQYRPGQHHGFIDVDSYFDWFDHAASTDKDNDKTDLFPEKLIHHFDWAAWSRYNFDRRRPPINATRREKIQWGLGEGPVAMIESYGGVYGEQCERGLQSNGCYVAQMMTHNRFVGTAHHVARAEVNFGEYITADVYFPCPEDKFHPFPEGELLGACHEPPTNLPTVIWLHPRSYHSGYNEGYIKSQSSTAIYFAIAQAGFAVICFDMSGFGTRVQETTPLFYQRYPHWSRLGKLVQDGLAAVDLATASAFPDTTSETIFEKPEGLPGMNPDQIFVVGYDIGGLTALYMGALDDRIQGIVSVNGWTQMRHDTNQSFTGGIRRLWDWHALQPILGFYDGQEETLPYDMEDVLIEATCCHRTTRILVYQQLQDRHNDAIRVREAVERARSAIAHDNSIDLEEVNSINMLDDESHAAIAAWLVGNRQRLDRSGRKEQQGTPTKIQ